MLVEVLAVAHAGRREHREEGLLLVLVERGVDGDRTALHRVVLLRLRELVGVGLDLERVARANAARGRAVARRHADGAELRLDRVELAADELLRLHPGGDPHRVGRAKTAHVEAVLVTVATRLLAAPAEDEAERVLRLARRDPHRDVDGHGAGAREADDGSVLHAEGGRGGPGDRGDVIPAELVDRIRELEEERVVRVTAVEDLRARGERDLEVVGAERRGGTRHAAEGGGDLGLARVQVAEGLRGRSEDALLERVGPGAGHRCRARERAANGGLDEVVALRRDVARDLREDLDVAAPAEERRDERLLDGDRAVDGAEIAPGLKLVGARRMPEARLARLVGVQGEVHGRAERAELFAELEVGRSVVDGVAAQDEQRADRALADVVDEGLEAGRWVGLERLGDGVVADGVAGVAERSIERVHERVDARGLPRAGDQDALGAGASELLGDDRDPLGGDGRRRGAGEVLESADVDRVAPRELLRERDQVALDVLRGEAQAMVGVHAGRRERRLDDVEAAHRVVRAVRELATGGEVPGRLDVAGLGAEEVAVEREDDLRLRVIGDDVDDLAEGDARALAGVRVVHRGPHVDLRLRELGEDRVAEADERGRRGGLDEEAELRAAIGLRGARRLGEDRVELGPGGLLMGGDSLCGRNTTAAERLDRAIGVVELEDGGLRPEVGRAIARGMVGVALDLGRAALVALHDDADGITAVLAHAGVVVRDAREEVLGGLRVREDLLDRATGAAFGGERCRAAGEEHEAAAADRGLGGALRRGLALAPAKLHERCVGRGRAGGDLGLGATLREVGALLVGEALPEDLGAVFVRGRSEDVRCAAAHR